MEIILKLVTITVLGLFNQAQAYQKAQFHNYRVYNLDVRTNQQLNILQHLEIYNDGYQFWQPPQLGRRAELMVPPHKFADFHEMIDTLNINSSIKIEDVQKLIDKAEPKLRAGQARKLVDWTDYNTYEEIYEWLDQQLLTYQSILTNIVIGESFEGRPIRALRLSHKPDNQAIFIEANIHAREWITSATATWFLNELLTSNDTAIQDLAQNYDWYIIPIFNIDGFAYTHRINRLWRKTRQNHATVCYGTDANRNFNYSWMGEGGASSNVCSELFAGPTPFSEPETAALANYVRSLGSLVKIYLSFHSYGQYLLFPFGDTGIHATNHDDLMTIGMATREALGRRYGTDYIVGTTYDALYTASGISIDWVYDELSIPISYTFEFRDHRDGPYGFVLPADQIIPNCLELRDGMIALVSTARNLGYI